MPRRKRAIAGLMLAVAAVMFSGIAGAQVIVRPWYRPYRRGNYGYGGTAAGSYLNGMANVIRAEGQYNLLTSQAGINAEEARSRYLDNRKKWTESYFQMKEEHQAHEAQQREKNKHSPETLAAAARSGTPRRLGPDALDPVTGQINWPEALLGSEYAALRTRIQQEFELRAKTSKAPGSAAKVHAATTEMSALLRRNIEQMPASEFLSGRKFLDSLDYAAQSPAT